MKTIIIANDENIDDIVSLRVKMQIEDWKFTLNKDFSIYSDQFYEITKNIISKNTLISRYILL